MAGAIQPSYHDLHHHKGIEKNFGVSSPLWDHVMRTYAHVEIPHAFNAPVLDE